MTQGLVDDVSFGELLDGRPVGAPEGDGFAESVVLGVGLAVAVLVLVDVALGLGEWVAVRLARGALVSVGVAVWGATAAGGGRTST